MPKSSQIKVYTGTALKVPQSVKRKFLKEGKKVEETEVLDPYIPDLELVKAVNLAILLKRPLLLMGEPGCGKSKLAEALAYELYKEEADFRHYFLEWHIKSSTKAREGLYEYDAIARLGEAQLPKAERESDILNKAHYVKDGQLGLAIQRSTQGKPVVLLIDEIDKADLDFPNDLLNELDKGVYDIPELRRYRVSNKEKAKPIVIITSNQEKPLPDALLRRCIYHYIEPLGAPLLREILYRRFYKKTEEEMIPTEKEFVKRVVHRFQDIRKDLRDKKLIVGKNVSTSELIDWYEAMLFYRQEMENHAALLAKPDKEIPDEELGYARLLQEMKDFLEQKSQEIPFRQVLFKNYSTLMNYGQS